MIRKEKSRLRLTFLGKFFLLTFTLAAVVANALALFLIHRHEAAVEDNEGTNAAGQIAALATRPLAALARGGTADAARLDALAAVAAQAKRFQYVTAFRVYAQDGRAVYPRGIANARDDAATTTRLNTLWARNVTAPGGEALRIEYVPFATPRATFVLAIDLSRALMRAQASDEANAVRIATIGAIALIFVALVVLAAGASGELERLRRQSQRTLLTTLAVLADAIDRRDHYTAGHSRRVATYSRLLANALRFPEREQDTIEHAALLHDIGKIGVPDAVLLKPSALDARERRIIGEHPTVGAEIIKGCGAMDDVVPCVLHHHERIDGTGYPARLANDAIPRGARVIAVADSFDAMTTDRPYRRALAVETAVAELRRVAGTQLDAAFVDAFAALVAGGRIVPPAPVVTDVDFAQLFPAPERVEV
ncbi:MAG: hypothetical protein NVSMB19_05480 [Vulcanimicrobiaceae bacterium]